MNILHQVEKISYKYADNIEEFIRSGAILNLKEKQRLLMIERFEILSRYKVSGKEELIRKIADSSVPEHPGWEDLIDVKNIESEMEQIEHDIRIL